MSRTDRRSTRAATRRYSTLSTLGALGAVTAVGLGTAAAPAMAAPAEAHPVPTPLTFGANASSGNAARTPHVVAVDRAPQRSTVLYTVRSGDTVSALAHRYDTTVRAIVNANDLNSRALIRVGQTLRIATADSPRPSGGSASSSRSSSSSSSSGSYKVRSGDTVSAIAHRYDTTVRAIINANNLNSNAMIRAGQRLTIPGAGSTASSSNSSNSNSHSNSSSSRANSSSGSYKVRAGDTVSAIAHRYDTTVRAIVNANNLNSNAMIRAGQRLTIPGAGSTASSSNTSNSNSHSNSSSSSSNSRPSSGSGTYTVRSGDTVSGIAHRHDTTVRAIINANNLNSNAMIRAGQRLTIPGAGSSSAAGGTANTGSSQSGGSSSPESTVTHKVIAGDTVSSIAAQYGTTVGALESANNLGANDVIQVGQRIQVPGGLVSNEFLHYTYSSDTTAAANANKRQLLNANLPSRDQMRTMIREVAGEMGVDPALALAIAHQESGFNAASVSPANAVGVMQVIPSSGEWASSMVGRELNLLVPRDNVTAGVAILRQLVRQADNQSDAIGGYYQGLGAVNKYGLYDDTRGYVANVQSLMTRYS